MQERKLFSKRAEEIIAMVYKVEATFNAMESAVGGDIYIGDRETDANKLIASGVKDFHISLPNIGIFYIEGMSLI